MKKLFLKWYRRSFSDPQVIILALLLLFGFIIVIYLGHILAPILASVVVAYLLEPVVLKFGERGIPRLVAVLIVFVIFFVMLVFMLLGFIPLLSKQVTQIVQELPNMIDKGQDALLMLPELYPNFISMDQVSEIISTIRNELREQGQYVVLSLSKSTIPGVITLAIYLVLVPFLVFFFLKDKFIIINWITHYLPNDRKLATKVWQEMDQQIGNYVRGKFIEIVIVGVTTYIAFAFMDMRYSMLLGVLVGLSVLVPYVGAVIVTVPVTLIAFFQWGWNASFAYLMISYSVIQALDGNLLVPLLFSEANNLHPVAIVVAVIGFGGLWGIWGVFFAIPLATLVTTVLSAWPMGPVEDDVLVGPDSIPKNQVETEHS